MAATVAADESAKEKERAGRRGGEVAVGRERDAREGRVRVRVGWGGWTTRWDGESCNG
jgi:hypothetical protein